MKTLTKSGLSSMLLMSVRYGRIILLEDWIQSLKDSQLNVHFLVTSRPEEDIKTTIESWAYEKDMVLIQSDLIKGDICAYIHARITEKKDLSRWKSRPDIKK